MENELYKEYWSNEAFILRESQRYYQRRYDHLKKLIRVVDNSRVLDVGGGYGHLLHYLGLKKGDILDISDSAGAIAKSLGYRFIKANIEEAFPLKPKAYDAIFCFEVLEHLAHPERVLSNIREVLKDNGVLYIAQPNMRPDGKYHLKRYSLGLLIKMLYEAGFRVQVRDYVPAFSIREAIINDIKKNPSWRRKLIQSINLLFSFVPWGIRYRLAHWIPDRFGLIFFLKTVKIDQE